MAQTALPLLRVVAGPSEHAPFAAAVAEFTPPYPDRQPPGEVAALLGRFLTPQLMARVALPLPDGSFESVAAALANALQDCFGANGFGSRASRSANGVARVMIGYADPDAALLALQTALDVTAAFFGQLAGRRIDAAALTARLQATAAQMAVRQPDPLARALHRAARARGIPVYAVAPGSRVWLYGQGSAGVHGFEAASDLDGMTGTRLGRNKFHSNQLVRALGFPGVHHAVADSVGAARRIARDIGYPVVVKPVASGKGAGVTVGVPDEAGLEAAFADALRAGRGDVLVERPLAGEDHRLVVIGGHFAWAVRRSPPRLTGDGRRTVGELIAAENRRRAGLPAADIAATPIEVDAEVRSVLAAQGLSVEACPPPGMAFPLRRIASISRGGTLADCTATVHPDNRDMAEAIARSFHLDAIGIDFMTPDIGRSWRESDCGVLEVNSTPGFSSDARAEAILAARFPPGGRAGRVPAVVLLGDGPPRPDEVAGAWRARGLRVGWTDGGRTFLDDAPRLPGEAPLPARVRALLLDAACDALVIAATPADLGRHGFPLDRCDLALVAEGTALSPALERLVADCAGRVRGGVRPEDMGGAALGGWLDVAVAQCRRDGGRP